MFKQALRAAHASSAVAIVMMGLLAPAAMAKDGVRITGAEAGLGGLVSAGRWVPVRVTLESTSPDVTGEIALLWGDATVRRRIALPTPGVWEFELYIRASDAASAIQVSVAGRDLASHSVPVAVQTPQRASPFDVCVISGQTLSADTSGCSAVVRPEQLPRSPRGYDAVDRLMWMAQDADLSPAQRRALEVWRSLQGLEQAGDLSLTPSVARPVVRRGLPRDNARVAVLSIGGLVASLVGIGFLTTTRALRLRTACLLAGAVGAAGTVAAAGTGRFGPSPPIHIQHASLLQQIPGTPSSRLTLRGIAEFPAFGAFGVSLPLDAAVMETVGPSERGERLIDETGHPMFGGRYGLGARQAFSADAMTDLQPLAVTSGAGWVTVSNASALTLTDCRFGEGFAGGGASVLGPGDSVHAERTMPGLGPIVTCRFDGRPLVRFDGGERPIDGTGTTLIAAYERRETEIAAAVVNRHD